MEPIDRARAEDVGPSRLLPIAVNDAAFRTRFDFLGRSEALNPAVLQERRIVSHGSSLASKSFDMLRAHVLRELDRKDWQFVAITSPTEGCGKTTIACNLALSMSRLSDRAPILVDMDLRRPSVARYLGLRCNTGIVDVLNKSAQIDDTMVNATHGSASLLVMPGRGETLHPSDWIESQAMGSFLQLLRHDYRNRTVIFDMPSILDNDDVISMFPRMDAMILVAASGVSTIEDIQACRPHLEGVPVIRVVANKVPQSQNGNGKF